MSLAEETKTKSDILDNLPGKLASGFYLDKINIDGKFKIWKQNKENLVLVCSTGNSDDGSDGIAVLLPLPIRFDEKWLLKFRGMNLSIGSIISYNLEGFIKKDLKE